MKHLKVFAVSMFVVLSANSTAWADGNEMLRHCTSAQKLLDENTTQDQFGAGICFGFVDGASGVMRVLDSKKLKICMPQNVTNRQIISIFTKFMRDNPQLLHLDHLMILSLSLGLAFNCNN